jgi:uncharacterized protein
VRPISLFVALTYVISSIVAFVYQGMGGKWQGLPATLVAVCYMYVPLAVAVLVQKLAIGQPIKKPFAISFRMNPWFGVALGLPVVLSVATFGVSLLFSGVSFAPGMEGMYSRFGSAMTPEQVEKFRQWSASLPVHPYFLGMLQALIAGATINAAAAFGEEIGWRGFLYKEFAPLGFWRSSTLIGLIWGVWHAPLVVQGYNYPQHPVTGVLMMIVWCLLLSPVLNLVRLKSGSVIATSVLHGTLNGSAGLAIMLIKGGNDLTVGMTGLAGFVVLIIVDLLIAASGLVPNGPLLIPGQTARRA